MLRFKNELYYSTFNSKSDGNAKLLTTLHYKCMNRSTIREQYSFKSPMQSHLSVADSRFTVGGGANLMREGAPTPDPEFLNGFVKFVCQRERIWDS